VAERGGILTPSYPLFSKTTTTKRYSASLVGKSTTTHCSLNTGKKERIDSSMLALLQNERMSLRVHCCYNGKPYQEKRVLAMELIKVLE